MHGVHSFTGQIKACYSPPPGRSQGRTGIFFLGRIPSSGGSAAWLRCWAGGAAGRLRCQAGMWRARYRSLHVGRAIKRGWASQYSESLGDPVLRVVGRASAQGRWASQYSESLGEPVLRVVGRASAQGRWASQYSESLGEPVLRVVGRASAKGSLGEPVLRGRWASQC